MDAYDKVLDVLSDLSEDDLISVWNEYCEKNNYADDTVYYMYDLDDIYGYGLDGLSITDIINTVRDDFGDFDTSCDYFGVTMYGYESFDSLDSFSRFDMNDLCRYIVDNEDELGESQLREVLEEIAESEEDEDEDEE
jgi:hypothetical protein